MKATLWPETLPGKWAVGLTVFFILLITAFIASVFLGYVSFDQGHAWDITLMVAIPIEIIAFIMSINAVRKLNDRSILVKLAVFIGAGLILFLFTHSLFIND